MLLVGAGLLMRSFVALQRVDLGLNPDNILVVRLPFPRGTYTTAPEKQRFFQQLLAKLHALPGVVAATETSTLPPYGGIGTDLEIPGKTPIEKSRGVFQLVSEGYAQTLGLRLTRGRMLSADDVDRRAQGRGHQRDAGQALFRPGESARPARQAEDARDASRTGRSPTRSSRSSA